MKAECFEKYQTEIHDLTLHDENSTSLIRPEIFSLIEKYQKEENLSEEAAAFFSGEYAFYQQQYEKALLFYLKAKSIPNYEFYCYRATAYAAYNKGLWEKAQLFIQKAQAIFPDDSSIHALASLLDDNHKQKFEKTMNTDASVFSFPKSHEPASTAALTERLYCSFSEESLYSTLDKKEEAQSNITEPQQCFSQGQTDLLASYLKQAQQRTFHWDNCLQILQGWNFTSEQSTASSRVSFLLTESLRKASGGYFLRWNGKGIVINPGKNFIHNFHQAGWHIQDIDIVIVTSDQPDVYADIKQIYELNHYLNSFQSEIQVIHYYLNQKALQILAPTLRPNFKQERNTVHCLELFIDSPDSEKIELSPEIILHYFPTSTQESLSAKRTNSVLGIKLELHKANDRESKPLFLGYISGTAWSPLISHHFELCDLLLTGFGSTNANDYKCRSYNADCLGYYGVFSLLEEVKPKLLLCAEFNGKEGDMRLKAVSKMRRDYAQVQSSPHPMAIFPADIGLLIDLLKMRIQCTVSKEFLEMEEVQVVHCAPSFGPLHYIAPSLRL